MKAACTLAGTQEPVCVHVELVDDVNMLRLALRQLTQDRVLRARLGSAARRYWEAGGTLEVMAGDYEDLLLAARDAADPVLPAGWPAHLRDDGMSTARKLTAQIGVRFPFDAPARGRP
jgi:hypothetical protein